MSDQDAWRQAILTNPRNQMAMVAYAGWLEDTGDAKNIRLAALIGKSMEWSRLPAGATVTYDGVYADGTPKHLENISPLRAMQHAAHEFPEDICIPLIMANFLEKLAFASLARNNENIPQTQAELYRLARQNPNMGRARYLRTLIDPNSEHRNNVLYELRQKHLSDWRRQDDIPFYRGHWPYDLFPILPHSVFIPSQESRAYPRNEKAAPSSYTFYTTEEEGAEDLNPLDTRHLILQQEYDLTPYLFTQTRNANHLESLIISTSPEYYPELPERLAHSPMFGNLINLGMKTVSRHNWHTSGLYGVNKLANLFRQNQSTEYEENFIRALFTEWMERGNGERNTMFRLKEVSGRALEEWAKEPWAKAILKDKPLPPPLDDSEESKTRIQGLQDAYQAKLARQAATERTVQ